MNNQQQKQVDEEACKMCAEMFDAYWNLRGKRIEGSLGRPMTSAEMAWLKSGYIAGSLQMAKIAANSMREIQSIVMNLN